MKRSLAILLLLCATAVQAATWNSDGSLADVQDLHDNDATHGDTITIPTGAFAWASTLTITKSITLQGAGIGLTLITNTQVSGRILTITLHGGAGNVGDPTITTRITGIEFHATGTGNDFIQVEGQITDNRRIRIDHCKWQETGYWAIKVDTCYGVIDHNIIIGKASGTPVFGIYYLSSFYNSGTTRSWGDGAWADADNFGTDKFIFVEDNVFTNKYTTSELTMNDSVAGGRMVFRYNIVEGGSLEKHGKEDTRDRSGRATEIYMNTFVGFNVRGSPLYMRGGTGVVWSNTFPGWLAGSKLSLLNNTSLGPNSAPFGGNSGNNIWDTNSASNPIQTCTATAAGSLTVTDNTKTWTLNQYANHTIRRTSGIAIASGGITRSGSTVTVNTSTAHGFSNNDRVGIWGANEYEWQNNVWGPITVTDSDTFTFSDVNSAVRTATGSGILCSKGGNFAYINSNTTGGELVYAGSVHSSAHDLQLSPGDTYEIGLVTHAMDQIGSGQSVDLGGAAIPDFPTGGNQQVLSPWYEWDNYLGAADVNFDATRSGGAFAVIVSGTHYNNNTQKPGYTPYTYPHPLVSGEPPDETAPTVTAFNLPATSASLTITVSTFTATDAVGVTGYQITESSSAPSAGGGGWSGSAPATVTASGAGNKTFYAWAKDAAGNVSTSLNDTVAITLPATINATAVRAGVGHAY